jgi:hypothetical protein
LLHPCALLCQRFASNKVWFSTISSKILGDVLARFILKIVKALVLFVLGIGVLCGSARAQIAGPKHESHLRHLFAAHRDTDNLAQRFDDLKCALVLIEAGQKLGTGFYVSGDGDVATASHVLGDRTFSLAPNNAITVTMSAPKSFWITNSRGERSEISAEKIETNPDAWVADVARLRTGKSTSCWLTEIDDRLSRPGEHLIAMGFPGLSFKTLTIYTGIMSARLTTNLPTMVLTTGQPIAPPNEFIRV